MDRDVVDLAAMDELPPGQESPKVGTTTRKQGVSVNRGVPSLDRDAPTGSNNSSATGEKAHPNDEERKNLLGIVRKGHGRVDPCFMTGKGCVYTDHIDKALRDRSLAEKVKGFMIMPYRPRLGVFFENCLRPFFYANSDKYGPEGMSPEEPKYITDPGADRSWERGRRVQSTNPGTRGREDLQPGRRGGVHPEQAPAPDRGGGFLPPGGRGQDVSLAEHPALGTGRGHPRRRRGQEGSRPKRKR